MRTRLAFASIGILVLSPGGLRAGTPEILPTGFRMETLVVDPFVGQPVGFDFLPDGRFVIVERPTGIVRIAVPGNATSDSVFTVPDVQANHAERGLLGVAVDPDWPSRPYLYFHYTHVDSVCHIAMATCSGALTDSTSTAVTLSNLYLLLDDLPDLVFIHNAGTVRFGPDGMLYVSVGDDSQSCFSADLTSPLGKLLRLDVSGMPGAGSGPPPKTDLDPGDNPFPGPDETERLVLAWGLRNPFRFTIDQPTGDVFIGSVGQNHFEEVNLIPGPTYPGLNFGWPLFDGTEPIFCCQHCDPMVPITDAIHLLPHPAGSISIIGGPVMRHVSGSDVGFPSSYDGDYFYFELFGGDLVRLTNNGGTWDVAPSAPGQADPARWGQGFYGACDARLGPDGALYFVSLGFCCGLDRGLYRIVCDGCEVVNEVPELSGIAEREAALRVLPNPMGPGEETRIELTPARARAGGIRIVDVAGRAVRDLELGPGADGASSVTWDGRDARGRPVPAGVYWVRALSADRIGSAKITVIR